MSESLVIPPHLDTSGIQRTRGPFTDIDDFLDAVNGARAGDEIILANGSYDVSRNKDTKFRRKEGDPDHPIIVRAETVGGATLQGSAGYTFDNCKFFTWYGFHHAHESSPGESSNISFVDGKNNRFARCEVNLEDNSNRKRHWLRISNCNTIKVDHCHFHHKKSEGQFCNVFLPEDSEAGKGPLFEYNYFEHQDFDEHLPPGKSQGDAGGEAIQMGHSSHARRFYRAIVRYNNFEECNGDGEIVSNKSCGNLYYNNTFTDCDGSLTLRHGHSIAVLGNYFKNCGLRIGGADNLIANNQITDNSRGGTKRPLVISNGSWPLGENGAYERVLNNDIILNTMANGDGEANTIVYWGSGKDDKGRKLKPGDNRFKGNIITGKHGTLLKFDNGAKASGKYTIKVEDEEETVRYSNEISDNIGWGDGRNGDDYFGNLTNEMADRASPKLERNEGDGIHRLQSSSPARNKFTGTPFSSLTTVDIFGMIRGENTDAGCCQFFSTDSSTGTKKRITPEDVGPIATTDLGDSPQWNPNSED